MIGYKYLSTLALALITGIHAENIAVVKTVSTAQSGSGPGGWLQCYAEAESYAIYRVSEHIGSVGSACSFDAEYLASSYEDMGTEMEGTYSDGYWVSGTMVFRATDKIEAIFCSEDDTTVLNCPVGTACWDSMERNLKCEGDWVDYFQWLIDSIGAAPAGGTA